MRMLTAPLLTPLLLATLILAACASQPDTRDAAIEQAVAQACTNYSLPTDHCALLMHFCFHEQERCEVMGTPILPPEE